MKILFINFNKAAGLQFMAEGFRKLGHPTDKIVLGVNKETFPEFISSLNARVEKFKPDIIFSYGYWLFPEFDLCQFAAAINHLRETKGIRHIYWNMDDPPGFEQLSLPIIKTGCCDLALTTAEELILKYEQYGCSAALLMFGCWPSIHRRVLPLAQYKHDLVLIANNYNTKNGPKNFRLRGVEDILKPVVENGCDIKVWGYWWGEKDTYYPLREDICGGFLMPGKEPQVYASTKIALGFQSVDNSRTMISCRVFEVLGCGAFHLTQYSPALETYFKNKVHLVWSESAAETEELVQYYLTHEREREKIALQGQAYVYRYHTFVDRARVTMKHINEYI